MSSQQQRTAVAISVILFGVYSWVMMGSAGTSASWAWLILTAAIVLLVTAGALAARTTND